MCCYCCCWVMWKIFHFWNIHLYICTASCQPVTKLDQFVFRAYNSVYMYIYLIFTAFLCCMSKCSNYHCWQFTSMLFDKLQVSIRYLLKLLLCFHNANVVLSTFLLFYNLVPAEMSCPSLMFNGFKKVTVVFWLSNNYFFYFGEGVRMHSVLRTCICSHHQGFNHI